MANNPLQQYFRQPKIYISLPVSSVYSASGTISGDSTKIPVFGMTGMDEIILKTPDALLSGESTAKVIASCCPSVVDPWALTNIEIDAVLVAIRIATYGNVITVNHQCPHCQAENEYEVDLGDTLAHYSRCKFDSKIVFDDLVIQIKPMNYKTANEFNLKSFMVEKKLSRIQELPEGEERDRLTAEVLRDLNHNQTKIIHASIEQIELPDQVVTEHGYIVEFLENCDRSVFKKITECFEANAKAWQVPPKPVKCTACNKDDSISMELNQTTFFGGA